MGAARLAALGIVASGAGSAAAGGIGFARALAAPAAAGVDDRLLMMGYAALKADVYEADRPLV
jgi:hypothetical protein